MARSIYSGRDSIDKAERRIAAAARRKGLAPYQMAQEFLNECIALNDPEGMKFWRTVWVRLMANEYVTPPDNMKPGKWNSRGSSRTA
ncbi:MAG TPA: hypothetical protein VL625_01900 [Patescibacteria group bacterium]|jgi:hypothetical protein|nr:hypothetical protein [Patescibacteria group bacterium]